MLLLKWFSHYSIDWVLRLSQLDVKSATHRIEMNACTMWYGAWLQKKYTAHHRRSALQLVLGCCSWTGATVPHIQIFFHASVSRFFHRCKKHGRKLMLRGSTSLIIEVPEKSSSDENRSGKKKWRNRMPSFMKRASHTSRRPFMVGKKMLGKRERKEGNHQESQRKRGSRKEDLAPRNDTHYMQLKPGSLITVVSKSIRDMCMYSAESFFEC